MESLILYSSTHKGNTKKIAEQMAEVLRADLVETGEFDPAKAGNYDLIGFGSGIYMGKHDKNQFDLLEKMNGTGKKAFVFCTSGSGKDKSNKQMLKALEQKGFKVLGSFACKGFSDWGPLKLIGGMGKGRPNGEDYKHAREFAKTLLA